MLNNTVLCNLIGEDSLEHPDGVLQLNFQPATKSATNEPSWSNSVSHSFTGGAPGFCHFPPHFRIMFKLFHLISKSVQNPVRTSHAFTRRSQTNVRLINGSSNTFELLGPCKTEHVSDRCDRNLNRPFGLKAEFD